MKNIVVYDIESMYNIFTYMDYNIHSKEYRCFIIWDDSVIEGHNPDKVLNNLINYINSLDIMIGYNNINYDYPLLEEIKKNRDKILNSKNKANEIYKLSQDVINLKYNIFYKQKILQIDLFALAGLDNKNKTASLKDIEFNMNWDNLMEMPFKHYDSIKSYEDLKLLLTYNKNDINATYRFFLKLRDDINLRLNISKKFNYNFLSLSDSRIGDTIVYLYLHRQTGKSKKDFLSLIKKRKKIYLNKCIFDNVEFKGKFNEILEYYKSKVISPDDIKGALSKTINYNGLEYTFGLGGVHASKENKIYDNSLKYIYHIDAKSYYPTIALQYNLYPKHIGKSFLKIYKEIYDKRILAKQEGDEVTSYAYKIALNSIFGKSNFKDSIYYDPYYFLRTTINGQLMLCMLCEMLSENNIEIINVNTDGLFVTFEKDKLNDFYKTCKQWEEKTFISLEYKKYKKVILKDVNNYISIDEDDKIKTKGKFFTIEKSMSADHSMRIVPIALQKYFIENKNVEETIKNHDSIFDFCIRFKSQSGYKHYILKGDKVEQLQRTNRIIVSNKGNIIFKAKGDRKILPISNEYFTILNKIESKDPDSYDVKYSFYIRECNKVINDFKFKQLKLF